ncbi:hypothetical protein E2C01_007924 [Portunus trituberculatus]|uniref:Uncharacterized protein n=1 Tax=Portunus trituberculatus TaxID=210409 RepID=A0A5B7D1Q6_PORTR|nr:hypothetical protein [Portunus trituberculatus]
MTYATHCNHYGYFYQNTIAKMSDFFSQKPVLAARKVQAAAIRGEEAEGWGGAEGDATLPLYLEEPFTQMAPSQKMVSYQIYPHNRCRFHGRRSQSDGLLSQMWASRRSDPGRAGRRGSQSRRKEGDVAASPDESRGLAGRFMVTAEFR